MKAVDLDCLLILSGIGSVDETIQVWSEYEKLPRFVRDLQGNQPDYLTQSSLMSDICSIQYLKISSIQVLQSLTNDKQGRRSVLVVIIVRHSSIMYIRQVLAK